MRSRDRSFWAWTEALYLLEGGEHWQRRFCSLDRREEVPCWQPAVDLYDSADETRLLVALPGVSAQQVEVVVDGDELVVRGERPMPSASQRAAILRLEIPYGRFERRIVLPHRDYRLHERLLDNGCLIIVLRHR